MSVNIDPLEEQGVKPHHIIYSHPAALDLARRKGHIWEEIVHTCKTKSQGFSSWTSMSMNFSNRLCLVSGFFAVVNP